MAVKKRKRKRVKASAPVQNGGVEPVKDRSRIPQQFKDYAWKPGQSGNPSGRPKGTRNFKHAARAMLQELVNGKGLEDKNGRQAYRVLLERAREAAATVKDYRFILEFLRYADEPRAEQMIREEAQKELVDALFPLLETFVARERWDEFVESVNRMIQRLQDENE